MVSRCMPSCKSFFRSFSCRTTWYRSTSSSCVTHIRRSQPVDYTRLHCAGAMGLQREAVPCPCARHQGTEVLGNKGSCESPGSTTKNTSMGMIQAVNRFLKMISLILQSFQLQKFNIKRALAINIIKIIYF